MKTIRLLTAILFLCNIGCMQAAPIDTNTAKKVALTFMQSRPGCSGLQAEDIRLAFTSAQMVNSTGNGFYAFHAGRHAFVIVSADDKAAPILAYSTTSPLSFQDLSPEIRKVFSSYHSAVEQQALSAQEVSVSTQTCWDLLASGQPLMHTQATAGVQPLIKTQWNQSPYYNKYCPLDSDTYSNAITGCTATGMAQIIRYWEYPRHGYGKCAYTHEKYGYMEVDYGKADYRYEDMPAKLDYNSSEKEIDAVARLMADCGIGVAMDYSPYGSGAAVLEQSGGEYSAEYVLKNYFGYVCGEGSKKQYEPLTWQKRIRKELDNQRPVLFAGWGKEGGHCFICDGYDDQGLFHFNFGWQGQHDGFYLMDSAYEFPYYQQAIFGLTPPNRINSHHIVMYSDWTVSSDTLRCGEDFNVRINVRNNGNKPFLGVFRLILENSQTHAVVAVFDTLSCLEQPLDGESTLAEAMTFHGKLEKLLNDNYNFRLQYRDTNADEWTLVPRIGNYTNIKSIRFDGGETTTSLDSVSSITARSAEVLAHVESGCSETVIMKAIQYKKSSTSAFTTVKDTSAGPAIRVLLDRLEAGTTYDVQSYVMVQTDATYKTYTSEKMTFTTARADGLDESCGDGIHISPNPSKGMVHIEAPEMPDGHIRVINPLGQQLKQAQLKDGRAELELENLPKGFYFISLEKNGRKIVQKIILE